MSISYLVRGIFGSTKQSLLMKFHKKTCLKNNSEKAEMGVKAVQKHAIGGTQVLCALPKVTL